MAQIRPVTSESLEATIRRLLPSQNGFGEDLQAQNVIVPIVDLTPTAEGSSVPTYMQRALAFGSQTAFDISGTTGTIINTPGFWQITGSATLISSTSAGVGIELRMSDGLSTKSIWEFSINQSTAEQFGVIELNLIVFLRAGDSLTAAMDATGRTTGSYRQVADVGGNLVNPSGFTPQ